MKHTLGLFGKKPKEEEPLSEDQARRVEVDDIIKRYDDKLKRNLQSREELTESTSTEEVKSAEYEQFRKENLPAHLNWYEKICNLSEKVIKIKPDDVKGAAYQDSLDICHLQCTPTGVASFAILGPLLFVFLTVLISYAFGSMFFVMFFVFSGLMIMMPLQSYPHNLASKWRMEASNQMVLCVFYVVTYMRHTSNIERAIEFAADHLQPPLSLDMKKVLWDVETEKYESMKESLDVYLTSWKKWNQEFIEAMHLVESSLYESDEGRRLELLDKSLDVILEETYEKMLHYAQNLNSPITMLNMLGVILPILGLVILPLVVSFMCQVHWYHLAAMYNIGLPLGVYYLGITILGSRPTGYGGVDVAGSSDEMRRLTNIVWNIGGKEIYINPRNVAIAVFVIFFLIGSSPLIIHAITEETKWDLIMNKDNKIVKVFEYGSKEEKFALLGYSTSKGCPPGGSGSGEGDVIGPYGLGSSILSLAFVLAAGLSLGIYFKYKSEKLMKIRERTKQLEQEFASALFQLGNRLGDGLPVEIAFTKVAEIMEDSASGNFFRLVASNITRMGMSVEQAIFDKEHGALTQYPSNVIKSSMKVLTEAAKKGPIIAAKAVINVSRYIKEIHRVDERLKDLLAEVVSSIGSQIKFLTPVIAGIVIGITAMITTILGKLGVQLRNITDSAGGTGGATSLLSMFGDGVPTFFFQFMVGMYVVQIVYILTMMQNGISNGADKLNERFMLGRNLIRSTMLYVILSLIVMLLFNIIAASILGRIKI